MNDIENIKKDLENIYQSALKEGNYTAAIQSKKVIADIIMKNKDDDEMYDFTKYSDSQLENLINKLDEYIKKQDVKEN